MKTILFFAALFFASLHIEAQDSAHSKLQDTLLLENIEITSLRADDKAPFTKTNLSKKQIEEKNLGYDLPFILAQTPSVVANSDAGNGIGYTNLRIRGTDATRINVTLNGIPYNDPESQGTFFVDMPDIASSLNSIQIQRGAGTSSNGSGAFGATINLSTNEVNKEKYLELSNNYGSFNTWKNTVKAGTGLMKNHFTLDARFSNITSDGYIDRAYSDLKSYFASAAYINAKTSIRFNFISGKEKTYQAWNGVPQNLLQSDRTYNSAGTEKPGKPYDNETDNYLQNHFQLFWNQKLNSHFSFNVAGFLVRGKGYYENYKGSEKFSKYGLADVVSGSDTIRSTDLILQQWLDNYFYGSIFSAQYAKGKNQLTIGGAYTKYDGGHYNIVTWAQQGFPDDYKYYDAPAYKQDFNLYAKWMYSIGEGFSSFIDLQQRFVNYEINGYKGHPDIYINESYSFLNPKVGFSFNKGRTHAYLSFSMAAKEPNRDDFEASVDQLPRPEKLYDWESGISLSKENYSAGVNFYFMDYRDQLVNTGKINDVGAYTRTNAAKSYRAGIELQGAYRPVKWFYVNGNIAFSKNKIKNFTEYIDDYDNGGQKEIHYTNTDISFSPNTVAAASINFLPIKNGEISFISKYVGRQFMDNTSNQHRSLDGYYVQGVRLSYSFSKKSLKEIKLLFQVNNLLDKMYVSNGYTYNYISDGALVVENFYFPMAGLNVMGGVNVRF